MVITRKHLYLFIVLALQAGNQQLHCVQLFEAAHIFRTDGALPQCTTQRRHNWFIVPVLDRSLCLEHRHQGVETAVLPDCVSCRLLFSTLETRVENRKIDPNAEGNLHTLKIAKATCFLSSGSSLDKWVTRSGIISSLCIDNLKSSCWHFLYSSRRDYFLIEKLPQLRTVGRWPQWGPKHFCARSVTAWPTEECSRLFAWPFYSFGFERATRALGRQRGPRPAVAPPPRSATQFSDPVHLWVHQGDQPIMIHHTKRPISIFTLRNSK